MPLPHNPEAVRPPQVGLIVLQSDETLEIDMRHMLPAGCEYLISRVPSGTEVTPDSLRSMETHLSQAAGLFPRGARLSAVAYGCTSGTAEIGAARIAELVRAGVETPHVTEPVSALIAACRTLGLARIGLVSPYIAPVSDRLRQVLAEAEIDVVRFASFEEPSEAAVARISAASIEAAALEVGHDPACEAVFLSCTNLRTRTAAPRAAAQLQKPILSSNSVLSWHLCHLAGINGGPDLRAGLTKDLALS